jgi:magnesium transporter
LERTVIEINEQAPWEALREFLEIGDKLAAEALLEALPPDQTVRVLFRLDADDQKRLLALVSPDHAAELLDDIPDAHAADLIEQLEADQAAQIVGEMPSDEGADLLGEMEKVDADAILEEMDPAIAGQVRELITFPTDVAGGLMEPEQFAYPDTIRVQDFLEDLEERRFDYEHLPARLLLLDARGRPTGAVELGDVLLTPPEYPLAPLAQDVITMPASASLNELEDYFDEYGTPGVPVVDSRGRLLGRVRRRALDEAIADRAQSDQLKVAGIVSGEELRAMPVFARARHRLSWLSVNIVLNIIAASVIAYFQDTVSAVIALAVFLPIVSDMSGCSGNQAVAVSLRELTLGIVEPRDVWRVWWQEVSVGLLNGLALGVLLSIAAYLWQGNPLLGAVVGVALGLNTVIAVSIGGTVPLLLKRLRADPAVASGPVLTTITDMCGFFLVLGLATIALPWLS